MIEGFEKQTSELTTDEKQLLPLFIKGLSAHIGKDNPVTSTEIIQKLKDKKNIIVGGARVRKLINHIRMHNLIPRLIATSGGYYITNDKKELRKYIESLKGREDAIKAIREKLESEL